MQPAKALPKAGRLWSGACLASSRRVLASAGLDTSSPASRHASTGLPNKGAGKDGGSVPVMTTAVVIERLPVVLPKPPEWLLEYEKFSFERSQRRRRVYPDEFLAAAAEPPSDETKRVFPEGQVDIQTTTDLATFFDDPSRVTPADLAQDTRSTQRALDKRLYLLVKGRGMGKLPPGVPDTWTKAWSEERWRLPEVLYASQDTLRLSAEAAASSLLSFDAEDMYFIGNAPLAHVETTSGIADGDVAHIPKRFLFLARWLGQNIGLAGGSASDLAWLTKDEALERLDGLDEKGVLEALLLE